MTMYLCKTMEDVLSRAWAQVKWEEDVASCAKAQPKTGPKVSLIRSRRPRGKVLLERIQELW